MVLSCKTNDDQEIPSGKCGRCFVPRSPSKTSELNLMSEKLDPDLKPPATIEQEILPEIEKNTC